MRLGLNILITELVGCVPDKVYNQIDDEIGSEFYKMEDFLSAKVCTSFLHDSIQRTSVHHFLIPEEDGLRNSDN